MISENRHTSSPQPFTPSHSHHRQFSFKPMWMQRLLNHSIFVRDESRCQSPEPLSDGGDGISPWPLLPSEDLQKCPSASREKDRPVTGLPRQATFKRQNSERRERLCPVEVPSQERRAISASRHSSTSCVKRRRTRSSPPPINPYRASTPAPAPIPETPQQIPVLNDIGSTVGEDGPPPDRTHNDSVFDYEERPSRPLSRASSAWFEEDRRAQLQNELDTRWILNLSMHFRDKSDREKFFVTYAETPTRWRRVTVSCDYRHAQAGSLEMDLKELQFQRDKSFAIYEAICESLPEIQFYDTVTNLKLETSDGRLHVHVTEDVNEIIPYPSRSMVRHVLDDPNTDSRPMEICEKDIAFEAHLSGFVYRVLYQDKVYIKKEIPSPDTIDEFLYEINALHALADSDNVIKLEAIILDDTKRVVKGLLISFAERGAVVDILYDNKGLIPWEHRERWARQAITGLRDIHEEGYVQGDFTLSNIVVNDENNAQIIDINRRGCPVGWEPPEIAKKIASNQRISMYIGEKSDLYQLGMTLWALAMDDDEPERHDPPLMADDFPSEVPEWFGDIVRICLSEKPRDRLSAKELVKMFSVPSGPEIPVPQESQLPPRPHPTIRTELKQYIDPTAAVERDDIERFKNQEELLYSPQSSKDDWTFTYPQSSQYDIESSVSTYERHREHNPASLTSSIRLDETPTRHFQCNSSGRNFSDMEPQIFEISPDDGPQFEELTMDGKPYLVRAGTFNSEELRLLDEDNSRRHFPIAMTLTPTPMPKSPSPFKLPTWRRSLSETTPKSSRVRLPSEARSHSPGLGPRTITPILPERPQSAEPIISARSSNETVSGCDASIGETNFSGTTSFSSGLDHEHLRRKLTDSQILEDLDQTVVDLSSVPTVPEVYS